jgi:hypothetical protein
MKCFTKMPIYTGRVAQAAECLLSKHEALCSNPTVAKIKCPPAHKINSGKNTENNINALQERAP